MVYCDIGEGGICENAFCYSMLNIVFSLTIARAKVILSETFECMAIIALYKKIINRISEEEETVY